jgi:apolipoprotein N-acyltransferase
MRKRGMPLAASLVALCALQVSIEWLHSLGDLSYPWLALGYTQLRSSALVQIADLAGVWGVSLIVIAMNAVIYGWIRQTSLRGWLVESPLRGALQLGGWMVAVVALPLLYGVLRLMEFSPESARPVRIAVVQPNINPWRKWSYADMQPMLDQHRALQDSLRRITTFELALWSETALPVSLLDGSGAALLEQIQRWCDSTGIAVLTGFAEIERYRPLRAYNAAILIAPQATQFPIHRKSRLTPFGEYMPYSDAFPALAEALQWGVGISSWAKGPGATVLPLVHGSDTLLRLGVMICIESIYPNYCADFVRRGATVLAVITNDAWYDGTPGPDQHFAIAQMRAIETRRPVVRCTNSGISGFISPVGSVVQRAPARRAVALAGTVVPHQEQTFYVRAGDWLPVVLLLIAGGMILRWEIARRRMCPRPVAQHSEADTL